MSADPSELGVGDLSWREQQRALAKAAADDECFRESLDAGAALVRDVRYETP